MINGKRSRTSRERTTKSYLVLNTTASLPNERSLVAGTGIKLTDAGAGSTATIAINENQVATISGSTFTGAVKFNAGLSGSLTNLTNGQSFIVGGVGIQVVSSLNGQILINNLGPTSREILLALPLIPPAQHRREDCRMNFSSLLPPRYL